MTARESAAEPSLLDGTADPAGLYAWLAYLGLSEAQAVAELAPVEGAAPEPVDLEGWG